MFVNFFRVHILSDDPNNVEYASLASWSLELVCTI